MKKVQNSPKKMNSVNPKARGDDFAEVLENYEDDDSLDDDASSIDSDGEMFPGSHKRHLESLKDKDPEFYEYLKSHDKELLEFDDEKEDDLLDEENQDEIDEEESKVTAGTVEQWLKILQNPSSKPNCLIAIKSMIKAFRRAVNQASDSSDSVKNHMNPALFNSIINSVLTDLIPALMHYLRLKNVKIDVEIEPDNERGEDHLKVERSPFFDPRRSRNWKRVLAPVKMYLTDVLKMVDSLSPDARVSFERHLLELVPFFNVFPHLTKKIIKRSIGEWSSGEERSRVLAFLILYRAIRVIQCNDHLNKSERQTLVNHILRRLYLAYAHASKTTNEITINKIVFMRNSLVELYQLDHSLAYQQAFIFMRQLCINLRKSILVKEKDALKRVFNWQYVHSIALWSQLIGSSHKQTKVFVPLLSPIINISFQTIHLFAPFKYVPFRLQIIGSMVKLASETQTFIPIIKFFREIIDQIVSHKNEIIAKTKSVSKQKKKKSKISNKFVNLDVILKVTKEQSTELKFTEQIVERIYEHLLYYLKSQSCNVSFPEMVVLFLLDVRKKIKSIPYPKGKTMMKQLLDKTEESSMFIVKLRQQKQLSIRDVERIETMEKEMKQNPDMKTPLVQFYEQWKQFKIKNPKPIKKEEDEHVEDDSDDDVEDESGHANGETGDPDQKKRKRNRKRNRKNKKPRTLNPDLKLDGPFDLSSDDDDD